jgi:hypothetical protein
MMEAQSDELWKSRNYDFHACLMSKGKYFSQADYRHLNYKVNYQKNELSYNRIATDETESGSFNLEVKVTVKCRGSPAIHTKFQDHVKAIKEVNAKIATILYDPTFSDFTFHLGANRFEVHKAILAAASPVFYRMFTTNMEESRNNECTVDNIDVETFKNLLQFVYGGELPDDLAEMSIDLYAAAHFYGIENLKRICKHEVHAKLFIDTSLEAYNFACVYDLEDLKMDAWVIIKR